MALGKFQCASFGKCPAFIAFTPELFCYCHTNTWMYRRIDMTDTVFISQYTVWCCNREICSTMCFSCMCSMFCWYITFDWDLILVFLSYHVFFPLFTIGSIQLALEISKCDTESIFVCMDEWHKYAWNHQRTK